MPDPRDDFSVIAASEHRLFGLPDPYDVIRASIEARLAEVRPDVVEAIELHGEPKWLTIARRDGAGSGTVVQFGFCARAHITVATGYGSERFPATVTFVVGDWDEPDRPKYGRHGVLLDLEADADHGFDDEVFRRRFLAFRDLGAE